MAEFPNFSLHLFDVPNFQMESRFPEIDATDLHETRENNQKKNTQRSTKTRVKVFDLWRAERSELRKLEEIPEDENDDVLCRFYAEIRKQNGDEYKPDSLAVTQDSLDRHLKNNGKSYSIPRDRKWQSGEIRKHSAKALLCYKKLVLYFPVFSNMMLHVGDWFKCDCNKHQIFKEISIFKFYCTLKGQIFALFICFWMLYN